ncbi:MAG: aminomethyl-transferring glycine dehydrogenase subunit GcvPA [Gammaproteobacteria bacterium]
MPHSQQDVQTMLQEIGVETIATLFDEIPPALKITRLKGVPEGLSEMEVGRLMQERAQRDQAGLCFIGAGAYEHHIPAAVWDIVSRGEYLTAYTPYQAEASQGTLQLLYEYQTMMANLTGMDVSNASLYDGATALAEAVLMAVRSNRRSKSKRILVPRTLHPAYRKVLRAITEPQKLILEELPYDTATGQITLESFSQQEFAALIIPQPNFFGTLEEVDTLTDWAHQHHALAIAVVNPTSLALLKAPGQWGSNGADIACGEGQPLGVPLASGGPYFGFICCKQPIVRQMPGRIAGRTVDSEGRTAFTLTLQAREQHIRRAKATSNICTNQSLLVTAATIYMSLLGAEGLRRVAVAAHHNAIALREKLCALPGVENVFNAPIFHEFVLRFNCPVAEILAALADIGIQGGYELTQDFPELGQSLLVCATETKIESDLTFYAEQLKLLLASPTTLQPPTPPQRKVEQSC